MGGETEASESGWTTDTLKLLMDAEFRDLRREIENLSTLLNERHGAQTKAMETALTAADKAVQAALLSAKEAVTKAEMAAEKRFEAVNEFRGQLSDQAATLLSRTEASALIAALKQEIAALSEKVDRETSRNTIRISEVDMSLTSRLDVMSGVDQGSMTTRTSQRSDNTQLISILGGLAFAISVAVAVIALVTR